MAYVNSSQIRVFPSVGRSNYDIESQLTNENNLSQIVRSLCRNRKSYVLSNSLTSNQPFEFVIYGFYFKILNANDNLINKLGLGNTLWAGIRLDKQVEGNNNSNHYQLLQLANSEAIEDNLHDLDVNDKFQGVVFGISKEDVESKFGESDSIYTLHLLENGVVPAQSLLHLNTTEILDGASSNYISDKFTTKQLNVSESISDTGTLNVTGHTTLSTLTASNTTISGALTVTEETTLASVIANNTHITETLNVGGHTTLSTLTATNTTVSGTLTVIEKTTLNTLTTESNVSIGGTLNVTGDTTLASVTATFVSAPTFSGSLSGNATTATNFNSSRTFTFSGGDISGSATSSTGGYTIAASIIDNHVTEAKIKDSAVTTNKIKDSSITTSKIDNGAVNNDKIANSAVTTNKIEDLNVTNSKIGNDAITNSKIANNAVTNAKIADGTIKTEKLGFNLNMVLKVDMVGEDDNEHQTLTISIPTLNNK